MSATFSMLRLSATAATQNCLRPSANQVPMEVLFSHLIVPITGLGHLSVTKKRRQ